MTFPKIYQRIFSCVNDMSMMIDVSIATVLSGVYFDYFLSFFTLFFSFLPLVCKKKIIMCFFVLILIKYVSYNKFIVSCMTAGSGSKMATSNSKMAGL